MLLVPEVRRRADREGAFRLEPGMRIYLPEDSSLLFGAELLRSRILNSAGIDLPVTFSGSAMEKGVVLSCKHTGGEEYQLEISTRLVLIQGSTPKAVFAALQTLSQIVHRYGVNIPCVEITDYPDFSNRGFYHDVTRGKTPSLKTLKWLVEKLAYYKINQLQLYIEHTFAFSNIPEIWTGRDPLTAEEIIELDDHCSKFHIELIPSMATFGHLYELLRLKKFEHLNELDIRASEIAHNLWDRMAHYTIDPLNGESFQLIKSMMEQLIPLFSSTHFNICCDETFDLGKGRNKKAVEESAQGSGRLYVDFVKKIAGVVTAHGKIPMMWGDIILHYPEMIYELPENTVFLNWGYGADITDENTAKFAEKHITQYVCPGTQGWSRFAYNLDAASSNIRKMVSYGKAYGAAGVLNTDWGDCGHVNSISGALYGMILGAALSWNCNSYSSDEEFDSVVSIVEWNEKSGKLYGLLRQLGSLTSYHFGNIYAWVYGVEGMWNREEQVEEMDFNTLAHNFALAGDIGDSLTGMSDVCGRSDFDELLWSGRAVQWTLGLLMFKKVIEYGQCGALIWDKAVLIRNGYNLVNEFIRLWRIRNKESELSTVVNTFRAALEKIQGIGSQGLSSFKN